jgi:hypothetical protein
MSGDDGMDSTWVHVVSCTWAHVATSHRDRGVRLPLPEALGLAMLIRCWNPPGMFEWRPGPCPRLRREAGRADRWRNPACLSPSYGGKVKAWIVPGISSFLSWWPLLFCLKWCGPIRYGVYGSPAIFRCSESVVSRILGHNRWPAVPGVLDPDRKFLQLFSFALNNNISLTAFLQKDMQTQFRRPLSLQALA